MAEQFLYQRLDNVSEMGFLEREIPSYLKDNLNPKFDLRPYQEEAFARFFYCLDNHFPGKEKPLHLLFNMATGSGKTLIMAGLILYLYEKGYRNFLFFVNSTNIIEKTKDNFLNSLSSKYLFNDPIHFGSVRVDVTPVSNFEGVNENDINICFTTIQQLHSDLNTQKENALTFEDFKDKKIVLLADEAHHINTSTKAGQELIESWENTVERIFSQNIDNLLLEFTATLDYTHPNLADKYRNKVLYKYDLRQFRNDGYSKDVYIVQADFEERDRIIQALILNQYKQEVAAKHQINLKPVILFKAQRTIEQSQKNKEDFHKLIEDLTASHIANIRRSDIPLVQRAFQFFDDDDNNISDEDLVRRLKQEFQEDYCLSVNNEREKENHQILVNTLEDSDNRIRAIFAVQKLNEGWDVLNLFDIVRCYTTRDARAGKPGKTTIAEAQLIGRGARYFPFVTDDNPDPYRRKFDKNLTTELRVLEELHYHSVNDSRYISEIRTALIDEGMLDERTVEKPLKLKSEFKETDFYKRGIIYINERIENKNESVRSFADLDVSLKNYRYSLATGRGVSEAVLEDGGEVQQIVEAGRRNIPVGDIPFHVVRTTIARNPFFAFKSLKTYFPHIQSVRQFIEADEYLGGLSITLQGDERYLLSNETYLDAMTGLLNQIASELRQNRTEYKGTESFKPSNIKSIFTDKILKLVEGDERADGDEQLVSDREWYVFNANYGTSEEKAFVQMLDAQIDELKEKYEGIYLVRNERHFKIYNFDDGEGFEPDFVLFLREKNGNTLSRQIFIEPKGKHLQKHEKWKKKFLKQIKEKFAGEVLEFNTQRGTQKYRLIGVPFYDNQDERQFRESLESVL